MRIWLINHYAVPVRHYPLPRTSMFAKYLKRLGHEVIIFCASTVHNSSKNLIESEVPFTVIEEDGNKYVCVKTSNYTGNGLSRIKNMFEFSARLPRICKNFDAPDIILASTATPMAAMQGLKLAKKYKCKGIIEVSDLWPESLIAYGLISVKNPIAKVMYAYEKRLYSKAPKIIFTMQGGKDYIVDKRWDKKIDLGKVYHINNGVDLEIFEHNLKNFQFIDDDLDDKSFKVVYCGSIRMVNNLKLLILAAQKLILHQDIKFIIFGDGDEKNKLEEYCKQNNVSNVFFKGFVTKEFIPSILSKSSVNVINVQQTEIMKYGCSLNKLFDYFASGKPIVSNLKVKYDLIEKYNCGILTKDQTTEAFAEAIMQIYQSPNEDYANMCENCLVAAQEYDYKMLTQLLMEVIDQ